MAVEAVLPSYIHSGSWDAMCHALCKSVKKIILILALYWCCVLRNYCYPNGEDQFLQVCQLGDVKLEDNT